jgi:hypothetical protein
MNGSDLLVNLAYRDSRHSRQSAPLIKPTAESGRDRRAMGQMQIGYSQFRCWVCWKPKSRDVLLALILLRDLPANSMRPNGWIPYRTLFDTRNEVTHELRVGGADWSDYRDIVAGMPPSQVPGHMSRPAVVVVRPENPESTAVFWDCSPSRSALDADKRPVAEVR